MQKWEYLVVFVHDSDIAQDNPEFDVHMDADKFTEQLNKYGRAGWELVNFTWDESGGKASFKRPVDSSG